MPHTYVRVTGGYVIGQNLLPGMENMLLRLLNGLRNLISPRRQGFQEGDGHSSSILEKSFGIGPLRTKKHVVDGEEQTLLVVPRWVDLDWSDWTRDEEGELLGRVMKSTMQNQSEILAEIDLPGPDTLDGFHYRGTINSNLLPHGNGTCDFSDLYWRISGEWENGALVEGSLYLDGNFEYEGKFQNGLPSGGRVYRSGSGSDFEEFVSGGVGALITELDNKLGEDSRDGSSLLLNWQEKLIFQLSELDSRIRELENSEISIDELLMEDESAILEFKASLWTSYNRETGEPVDGQNKKNFSLEDSVLKTIAGFLNTGSGTLLIGVRDKARDSKKHLAEAIGIEPDFQWLKKGKKDSEGFEHSLRELMRHSFSNPSYEQIYVSISFPIFEDRQLCRVDVEQIPVGDTGSALYCKTKTMGEDCFFVRSGDSTISHSMQTAHDYIQHHFGRAK